MARTLALMIALLLLAGCTTPIAPSDPAVAGDARAFSSTEELETFLSQTSPGRGVGIERLSVAEDAAAPQAAKADYSGTNVQVEGVDEADLLKTDGDYIYTITENTLFIVRAGEDAEIVGQATLENRPRGLFLSGDALAIMGDFSDTEYFAQHDIRPRNGMTFLAIYDVSDKENPSLEKEYLFEGGYFDSRMANSRITLVTAMAPQARPVPMPIVITDDVVDHMPVSSIYRYDLPYSSAQFANVHQVDLVSLGLESKTVFVESPQAIYMNDAHLYLASTTYINEWEVRQDAITRIVQLPDSDKELVRKIEQADDEVLSADEKRNKIFQVYSEYVEFLAQDERERIYDELEAEVKERLSEYESLERTVLHKLAIEEGIALLSSAEIPGRLVNQFALDEHEGVLRTATTLQPRWWGGPMPLAAEGGVIDAPAATSAEIAEKGSLVHDVEDQAMIVPPVRSESTNRVFTLSEDMEVLDSLADLAVGEQIYSARFMGDLLYLVTFRQTDPFFVIDLSDPADIEVLGELKVTGFSRYLHPYGDDIVIGFGREATETGRQQGLKISLFDVSDVADPREIAKWTSDERFAQSTAEYEHHAFLFDRERELLVIPVSSYPDYRSLERPQGGALVFRITRDEIELRGLIDHKEQQVERSLYIDDLLYTKSPRLLRINELDDLSRVKDVELVPEGGDSPYPVY